MTHNDELLRIVVADLKYFRDTWEEDLDEDHMRRDSAVLRRLLVDGALEQVRRALGLKREPRVTTFRLNGILKGIPPEHVRVASSGGFRFKGANVGPGVETDAEFPCKEILSNGS